MSSNKGRKATWPRILRCSERTARPPQKIDSSQMECEASVDELRRLEGYHAFMNEILLSGAVGSLSNGDSDVFSPLTPQAVIDDPISLSRAAEKLVLNTIASRHANLYLLHSPSIASNILGHGGNLLPLFLTSWSMDERGQPRIKRIPVAMQQDEIERMEEEGDSTALGLNIALREEGPLLLGGVSLVARILDRKGQVLGLVEVTIDKAPEDFDGDIFPQAQVSALDSVQDELVSVLLLLRLVLLRSQREDPLLAPCVNQAGDPAASGIVSPSTRRIQASSALGNPPVNRFSENTSFPRKAHFDSGDKFDGEALAPSIGFAGELAQQPPERGELNALRQKYLKAKSYIRRLERGLRLKTRSEGRALLARQATEGAERLFARTEELQALITELSGRQEQLRLENETLRAAKVKALDAANAASSQEAEARTQFESLARTHARSEDELRTRVYQLDSDSRAMRANAVRYEAEKNALIRDKERLERDLLRCQKKLKDSQQAVKQARDYQEISQAELWDLKESLERMEAGTNELRQHFQYSQNYDGGDPIPS